MTDLTDQEILDAVEAEFQAGGRPLARYLELGVIDRAPLLGSVLTTRIIRNFEERLVALERGAGMVDS